MKATNVTSADAADETPVRDEIAALEQQILYRRERLKSRSYALEYQVRKRVASPYTLVAALAAGFFGERLLRSRNRQPDIAHHQKEKPQDEGFLSQALKAVTLVQGIMASPVIGMLRRQFDEYQARSARESAASQAYQPGNTRQQASPNNSGSTHYH
jgi:hypothetical protein